MKPPPFVAFEYIDILDGLCSVGRRGETLDGAVPLRAAQACVPFLKGNAYGFVVSLHVPIRIERTLLGVQSSQFLRDEPPREEMLGAAIPTLLARGLITEAAARALAGPIVRRSHRTLTICTGLLVRSTSDVCLRVCDTLNRRSYAYRVDEDMIPPTSTFEPLVLTLRWTAGEGSIEGEVASLLPLFPRTRLVHSKLAEVPELGTSHASFYDDAYFDEKRRGVTKKYRRHRALPEREDLSERPDFPLEVTEAGPAPYHQKYLRSRRTSAHEVAYVEFANPLRFAIRFDGYKLAIDYRPKDLTLAAIEIEATWGAVYGEDAVRRDRRALWYLTKYFTPHPPGEPYFFVKPWAFVRTVSGFSCLVEGMPGSGYDTLRGVVETDWFHAVPAVFAVWRPGEKLVLRKGQPLVRTYAIPRQFERATCNKIEWSFP